jgi:hypothetical protein
MLKPRMPPGHLSHSFGSYLLFVVSLLLPDRTLYMDKAHSSWTVSEAGPAVARLHFWIQNILKLKAIKVAVKPVATCC